MYVCMYEKELEPERDEKDKDREGNRERKGEGENDESLRNGVEIVQKIKLLQLPGRTFQKNKKAEKSREPKSKPKS